MSGRPPAIVRVGLDLPVRRLFDYLPEPQRPPPPAGSRVRVTCAGAVRCGIVAAVAPASRLPRARLLRIEEELGGPLLPADLLACVAAAARSFFLPPGRLLVRCLPPSLRQPRRLSGSQVDPAAAFSGPPPQLPSGLRKRFGEIVAAADARPILISGPPGSGKERLLIAWAAQCLAGGGRMLLLAPTVAAAAFWHRRLVAGLPGAAVVQLHSGLKGSEFKASWQAAAAGAVHVVVGARSAVFAPLPDLALVAVVDEHEGGHRTFTGPRYSAREIAALRARTMKGCRLALLSATPSLAIRHAAKAGTLRPVALPRSPAVQAPRLAVADTAGRRLFAGVSGEFELLVSRMVREKQRIAVLASRADRAGALACGRCGFVFRCRQCAGPLVEHQQQGRCRYCRLQQKLPAICGGCKEYTFAAVRPACGQMAEALAARISGARILTVDRTDIGAARQAMSEDSADVLIGGSELAELGPAFGAVVLADADNVILSGRLDAVNELLAAVTRLAWRECGCEILAQTQFPDHHLFEALRGGIHDSYALAELEQRRKSGLPPFRRLALISARGPDERRLARFLGKVRRLGQLKCAGKAEILDPVAGRRSARGNQAQMQLLISAAGRQDLHDALAALLAELESAPAVRGLRWDVEVDPQSW